MVSASGSETSVWNSTPSSAFICDAYTSVTREELPAFPYFLECALKIMTQFISIFHRSNSSCFDIYSFLKPLIIRTGHLRWRLAQLVTTFGKKLTTITDVLITVSGNFCHAYCTFGRGSGVAIILAD